MQSTPPVISVILPCFNASQYLAQAIDSVLQQTFREFELIIIDDGSSDDSMSIIARAAKKDDRIRIVSRENKGLVATLNEGIALARGRYIARMDADDVSRPDRLLKQWQHMESHPEVMLCGTWARTLGEPESQQINIMPPTTNDDIRALMLFQNCFVHPSIMMQRECVEGSEAAYRPSRAEDYDLWARICAAGAVSNLAEILLDYRIHEKQLTQVQSGEIQEDANLISRVYLESSLGITLTADEIGAYRVLATDGNMDSSQSPLLELARKLLLANARSGHCKQQSLEDLISKKLVAAARNGHVRAERLEMLQLLPILGARRLWRLFRKINRAQTRAGASKYPPSKSRVGLMKNIKTMLAAIRAGLGDRLDMMGSRSIDISECKSVCLALGPYRNLTTLTAATLFLHPECQVLNHAGMRIYGNPEVDFLNEYSSRRLDHFVQYAIKISAKGNRGNTGGSITHSHAFDDKYGMKQAHEKLAPQKQNKQIKCLFWKESLKTSNLIRDKKIDLGAIFSQDKRLRFLLPIRNPMDCAKSNLKTGHAELFAGATVNSSMADMTRAVLDEILWVAEWKERYPDRFFYFLEHEISQNMLRDLEAFIGLDPDPVWLENAFAVMKTQSSYVHDDSLIAEYKAYIKEKFERFPELADKLLKFAA